MGRISERIHSGLLIDKLFIKTITEVVGLEEVPMTRKSESSVYTRACWVGHVVASSN